MMPNKKPIHIYSLQISKEWFYQNTRRKCAVNIQRSDSDVIRWKVISMRSTQYPELHSVRCRYIAASQEIVHSHVPVQFNPAAVTSAFTSPFQCASLPWFSYYQIFHVYNLTHNPFQPLAVKYCSQILKLYSEICQNTVCFNLFLETLTAKYFVNILALRYLTTFKSDFLIL